MNLTVTQKITNAFTVDVEDYFQVSAFEHGIARDSWDGFESRVVGSTRKLLELLNRHEVSGTFFVLGWVAAKFPSLVREIQDAGHELGSHSFWHRLVYTMSPEEFRSDLQQSRAAIEDACGTQVTLYRAPSFSITKSSLWALDILAEEGFLLDSSIFPTRHDRYGIPGAQEEVHSLPLQAGCLTEFPPTVARLGPWRLPAGGGGYFRLYPWWLTKQLLAPLNRAGRPFMFYVHPWEVDPDQPRLKIGSRVSRFRHCVGLAATERKLDQLLRHFSFGTISQVVQRHCSDLQSAGCPSTAAESCEAA